MSEALELVLPMPPNLANSRMHWRVKHKAKLEYWALCAMWLRGPDSQKPRTPLPHATISSVMYLGAPMDMDNAMARHKWALDYLTEDGWIVDDRRKCLTWTRFPEQIIKRDGNYRIVLSISAAA